MILPLRRDALKECGRLDKADEDAAFARGFHVPAARGFHVPAARRFHVPAMKEELERFGVFRSRSSDSVFLDIFDAVGPLGEAIIRRRPQASVGGRDVWVIVPEDLALLSLKSRRPLRSGPEGLSGFFLKHER